MTDKTGVSDTRPVLQISLYHLPETQNDPEELDSLTRKWREASQEAADELVRSSTHDPPPTVAQLLDYLNIDHALIQYSVEEEAFY